MRGSATVKRTRRYLAALLLALCVQTALLSVALAHAELVRSDPADNSAMVKAPDTVRLWFSEPVAPGFTGARILNEHDRPVPGVLVHIDASDPTLLVLKLPALPDGVYTVAFTALSAADGHTTQGHIAFKIGAGPALEGGAAGTEVSWPEVVLRWLDFAAQAGVIGALAVAVVLLRPMSAGGTDAPIARGRRRVLAWGAACALLAVIVGAVSLYRQAGQLAEALPGNQPASVGVLALQLLVTTRAGQFWVGRLVLLIVIGLELLALSLLGEPALRRALRPTGLILGLMAAGVVAATAISGHASDLAPNAWLAVLVNWAHLLAAGLWVGGLLALAVGLLPLLWQRPGTPVFAEVAQAGWGPFGRMAALSVATLFATGLYNTGREVASLDALLTTLYGRTLIAKVAVVLAVGAIGLFNSMLLHPAVAAPAARLLHRPKGWRPLSLARLPGLIMAEVSLGLVVLLLTGLLTSTAPPHGAGFDPQPATKSAASALQATADDLQVSLSAEPNLPGDNRLTIRVTPSAAASPEILRVIVRFTYLAQRMGETSVDAPQVSPGLYELSGSQLSLSGPWQVSVAVRRKGVEDSAAHFTWTVPAAPATHRVIVSDRPWEAPLTAAAAVLALLVLSVFAALLMRRRSTLRRSIAPAADPPSPRHPAA